VGVFSPTYMCAGKGRSVIRIIASSMKAATVRAYRPKSHAKRRLRLIQARVRSTIQPLGKTTNLCSSLRLSLGGFAINSRSRRAHLVSFAPAGLDI